MKVRVSFVAGDLANQILVTSLFWVVGRCTGHSMAGMNSPQTSQADELRLVT